MTNFLIYPTIDNEHGFPSEVNRAIASSPEMSEVASELVKDQNNLIRRSLDVLYSHNALSPGDGTGVTRIDGGTP